MSISNEAREGLPRSLTKFVTCSEKLSAFGLPFISRTACERRLRKVLLTTVARSFTALRPFRSSLVRSNTTTAL